MVTTQFLRAFYLVILAALVGCARNQEPPAGGRPGAGPPPPATPATASSPWAPYLGTWELSHTALAGEQDSGMVGFRRLTIKAGDVSLVHSRYEHYADPKPRFKTTLAMDVTQTPPTFTLTRILEGKPPKIDAGVFGIDPAGCLTLAYFEEGDGVPGDISANRVAGKKKQLQRFVRVDPTQKSQLADVVGEWEGKVSFMAGNTLSIAEDGNVHFYFYLPIGQFKVYKHADVRLKASVQNGGVVLACSLEVDRFPEQVNFVPRLSLDKQTLLLTDDRLSINPGWQLVLARKK